MIKLSEAIKLGAMLASQQAFYVLYNSATGGTCALGAAAEAVGILDKAECGYREGTRAPKAWKPVALRPAHCPMCGQATGNVMDVMVHLNNEHRQTREQIADWVASVERAVEELVSADAVDPSADIREQSHVEAER